MSQEKTGTITPLVNPVIWEAQELDIQESDKKGTLKIKGTALATGRSRNGVNYRFQNLEENNNTEFNVIVGHRSDYDNPDHNVGEGVYLQEGNKLNFDATIHNNSHHPDITESIKKGLTSVSIHGGYASSKIVDGERVIEGLRIPLLALVNKHARGVVAASIEAAVEEREQVGSERSESKDDKKHEVGQMAEQQENLKSQLEAAQLQLKLNEKETTLKSVEEKLQKVEEKLVAHKKGVLVESLLQANKDLDKKELLEKEVIVLETMLQYEQKSVKESEDEKKDGSDAGQVDTKEESDGKDNAAEKDDGIVINERAGTIEMTKESHTDFNNAIREKLYGKEQ